MDKSEHKLIKLLLDKDFYNDISSSLTKEMFPDSLGSIYKTIQEGHSRYERDLSLDDVKELYKILFPAATRADRNSVLELLIDIENDPPFEKDLAKDILEDIWRKEIFRQLASLAVDGINGELDSLEPLQKIIDAHKEGFDLDTDLEHIDLTFEELKAAMENRAKWKFNIPTFADKIPGAGEGDLVILFARPETGKTAAHISFACAPGGFIDQGAKVAVLTNEEAGTRTLWRGVGCHVGMTPAQMLENEPMVIPVYKRMKECYHVIDDNTVTIDVLDAYCKRHKPDILIVDQLDKVHIEGSFKSDTDKLRAIYVQAREIAKRHKLLFFAVCQASFDGQGKTKLHFSMMENSKTGKAAEADLIIGIGKRYNENPHEDDEDEIRYLTVSKNKVNGYHGTVVVTFDRKVDRYGV